MDKLPIMIKNEEIDKLRLAATTNLLTRKDTLVVASVSCIYGLGSPVEYQKVNLKLTKGEAMTRATLTRKLISIYFERESEQTVKSLTTAIEPLMMVILGVGVGLFVYAVITPIYNLVNQFK